MKPWIRIERIPGVLASAYEKATRMVIDSYYSGVADEIADFLTTGAILDLGTGPGYLPIEIVKRRPGLRITGVDLSRKLIRIARANATEAGFSQQLSFEVGNSAGLRFENGAFDMVISTGMLHSLKDPVKVLKEIHRVLKEGGQAWMFDPARVTFEMDREKWKASLSLSERFFLRLFKLFGLHKSIETYRTDEVQPMIEASGFRDCRIEERDGEIRIKLRK